MADLLRKLSFLALRSGHNGVKSVISSLGTEKFFRLRIGIGQVKHDTIWVLSSFTSDELKLLEYAFETKGLDLVRLWAEQQRRKDTVEGEKS